VFHHRHDAIEALPTIVSAALAVARLPHDATGVTIKTPVRTRRPPRTVTIDVDAHTTTAEPRIDRDAEQIRAEPPPVTR
jgi:hypothetical protein